MKPIKINVNLKNQKYSIVIGLNIVSNISKIISKNHIQFEKCLIIVDKNVPKKIISKIKKSLGRKKISIYFFTASEKNKNT